MYNVAPPAANQRPDHYYGDKAQGYLKVALGLERRAKRAGKNSAEHKRYCALLETYLHCSQLARQHRA
jgi:hypothetical protein